jgi:peroxiredoxin
MKKTIHWWILLGIPALGICLVGCLGIGFLIRFAPGIYEYALENRSLDIGDRAPNFELSALTGETIRLHQFRGQPVLLSLGKTWCPPCRAEAPLLEEVHQTHSELVVLLVDIKENPDIVQDFADEFGISHPILLDVDRGVSQKYQVSSIPTTFFIDKQGVIRAKIVGEATPQLLAEYLPLIGIDPD